MIRTVSSGTLAGSPASFVEKLGASFLLGGTYSPQKRIPWHRHLVAHCTYVVAGSYWEDRSGSRQLLQGGDLLFHPKGEVHADTICREGASCLNIEFSPGDALVPALEAINRREEGFARWLQCAARRELASTLPRGFDNDSLRASKRTHALKTFHCTLEAFLWSSVRRQLPRWLNKCMEEIAKDAQAPSLRQLAKLAQVHPTHMVRSFGIHLGQTPGQYMRARRVAKACDLLIGSNASLAEVALTCGFCDQAHFCRVFRASAGKTPGQFRVEGKA